MYLIDLRHSRHIASLQLEVQNLQGCLHLQTCGALLPL